MIIIQHFISVVAKLWRLERICQKWPQEKKEVILKSSHIVVGCSENVCMQWALDDKWQELQRRCPGNRSSSPRVQVCRSVKWDGCYAWGELQTKTTILREERRREEGSWLTWGLSCSSLPQLLMNAEQFFMHTWPRKNERLLCDRDSLISNTKAFVCHLGISLLYSSALLRLSTAAAAAKGSSNKKRRTELKVVKNVAADWLQVATLLLASFI